VEAPVEPQEADSVDAYTLALRSGDCYVAQLAALLNCPTTPPEAEGDPGFVVEEPDF